MIHLLADPETHRLKARLRELLALQARVSNEVRHTRDLIGLRQERRRTVAKPPCGSEQSYQWHRYHERDQWPLPADDPCGCRQAHAEWNRLREAIAQGEATERAKGSAA